MKKLLTTIAILATIATFAQDKRFTIGATSLIVNEKEAFNIGVELEYQMEVMYFKAGLNLFPEYKSSFVPEIKAGLGFNYHTTFSDWRYFSGGYVTWAIMNGYHYKSVGPEVGIERYWDSFFIGVNANYVYSDLPLYQNKEESMFLQFGIKTGFSF